MKYIKCTCAQILCKISREFWRGVQKNARCRGGGARRWREPERHLHRAYRAAILRHRVGDDAGHHGGRATDAASVQAAAGRRGPAGKARQALE